MGVVRAGGGVSAVSWSPLKDSVVFERHTPELDQGASVSGNCFVAAAFWVHTEDGAARSGNGLLKCCLFGLLVL